jgi:hypothetical protein
MPDPGYETMILVEDGTDWVPTPAEEELDDPCDGSMVAGAPAPVIARASPAFTPWTVWSFCDRIALVVSHEVFIDEGAAPALVPILGYGTGTDGAGAWIVPSESIVMRSPTGLVGLLNEVGNAMLGPFEE